MSVFDRESGHSPQSLRFVIPAGIRWIVFDAVGTLIRPTPSVAVAYQTVAARYGSCLTVSEAQDRFRNAFERSENDSFPGGPPTETPWQTSPNIEIARWQWIVREVVRDVREIDQCFQDLWDHFSRPTSWTCFDDVQAGLKSLSAAGYRLAIASNFDSRLHPVCDGREELRQIERKFVSSEIGYRKPATAFFREVIMECGVSANQILMVGDDPEHDVAGPKACGMQAVFIDRGAATLDLGSIRTVQDLVPARPQR